jgi:subtilisin family serine protease
MPLYIIRPKESSLATRTVDLIARRLAPEDRKQQINEVASQRTDDPSYREINKWLDDQTNTQVKKITHESSTPITGTKVVDMTTEEAERFRREVPDALVLRDQPIELIRPLRVTAQAKQKLTTTDRWHLQAIGLQAVRKKGFGGTGQGVTVAVLDTGIHPSHPELDGRLGKAYSFDVSQWTAIPMTKSKDTDGHGTHVAGLICGKTVGVAPGARVVNAIMLPQGRGNLSDFLLALEWAGQQPDVQIVNMSAGIPGYVPEMLTAVAGLLSVGVLPIFAIGNEGRNKTRSPGNYVEVVSVGATNSRGRVASFSGGGAIVADNHRTILPDLVAPGEGVYSCVMGGGYEAWDGTSMATPIVSGVAALVLEKYPTIRVTDLVEELLTTCKDLKQAEDRQGQGLIQVRAAL